MSNFDLYIFRANEMYDIGFSNKTQQQDCIDYINRAYAAVKEELNKEHFSRRDAAVSHDDADAWYAFEKEVYWGIPDCHVYKAQKHGVMLAKYKYDHFAAKFQDCANLRALAKAAAVVPKPKVKTQAQIDADAKARTCQICGRPIFAETGMIAHHGYTRPGYGQQTSSCIGARELPFENSNQVLVKHIEDMKAQIVRKQKELLQVQNEEISIYVTWTVSVPDFEGAARWQRHDVTRGCALTRATFEEKKAENHRSWNSFDDVKAKNIASRERDIKLDQDYLAWQEGRLLTFKQIEIWNTTDKKWNNV